MVKDTSSSDSLDTTGQEEDVKDEESVDSGSEVEAPEGEQGKKKRTVLDDLKKERSKNKDLRRQFSDLQSEFQNLRSAVSQFQGQNPAGTQAARQNSSQFSFD